MAYLLNILYYMHTFFTNIKCQFRNGVICCVGKATGLKMSHCARHLIGTGHVLLTGVLDIKSGQQPPHPRKKSKAGKCVRGVGCCYIQRLHAATPTPLLPHVYQVW